MDVIVVEFGVDWVVVVVVFFLCYFVKIFLVLGINNLGCIKMIFDVMKVFFSCEVWFIFYEVVFGKEVL